MLISLQNNKKSFNVIFLVQCFSLFKLVQILRLGKNSIKGNSFNWDYSKLLKSTNANSPLNDIAPNIFVLSWPTFSSEHLRLLPISQMYQKIDMNFLAILSQMFNLLQLSYWIFLAINSQISFLSNTKTQHSVRFAQMFTHIFLVSCVCLFYVKWLQSTIISWKIKKIRFKISFLL